MGDDKKAVKQEKYDQKHLMLHTFKWDEFARNGVIKCGAVKKKDKDGTDNCWCAVIFNFIVFYKCPHQPKEPTEVWHDKAYELLRSVQGAAVHPLTDGKFGFSFTYDGKQTIVYLADFQEQDTWIKKITTHVRELQKTYAELEGKGGGAQLLEDMRENIPRNFNPELADRVERIPGFIKQMTKAFADQKRHFNEANMMRRFADFYTPNSKSYMDWMLGSGFGDDPSCERYLQKVEKKQLDMWRKKAAETVSQMAEAFEQRFFTEDLEPMVKRGNEGLLWIDGLNKYMAAVHPGSAPELKMEETLVKTYLDLFSKLPSSKTLTLDSLGPGRGQIIQMSKNPYEAEKWFWGPDGAQCKLESTSHDHAPVWTCTNGYEFKSEWFGAVLWNRVSWVWFHPRIRFVIRYEYYHKESRFKFRMPKDKKAGEYHLPDWHYNGKEITAVHPTPKDPELKREFYSWKLCGRLPIPLALLVSMMGHIEETCGIILSFEPPKHTQKMARDTVFYTPLHLQKK